MPKPTKSPDDKLRAMEKRIEELEKRNEQLSDRLEIAEWRAFTMIFTKVDNPRYPYYNWLLEYTGSEAQRTRLNEVLGLLADRITGQHTVAPRRGGSARQKARLAYLPKALIERTGPPTKEEILEALRLATGMKHDFKLLLLIRAIHDQGVHPAFCEYAIELFGL